MEALQLCPPTAGIPASVPSSTNAPVVQKATTSHAGLSWKYMKSAPTDNLWWFGGETPAGFYTEAMLHASGYKDDTLLTWRIVQGADKVDFTGPPSSADVTIGSIKGSDHPDDIQIEVREGNSADAPSGSGTLTVHQPSLLKPILPEVDHPGCPPNSLCPRECLARWTDIQYQVVSNLGEIIENVPVNEKFPGPRTNDEPNDWIIPSAMSKPFFENVKGSFTDRWAYWCGHPHPVSPDNPTAYIGIDQIPHEFYVGSEKPGLGVRVQKHIAHRYLGYTRHEKITSPAP